MPVERRAGPATLASQNLSVITHSVECFVMNGAFAPRWPTVETTAEDSARAAENIRVMRTVVWSEGCLRTAGVTKPSGLLLVAPVLTQAAIRSFERYRRGQHLPRDKQKDAPGIVNKMEEALPGSKALIGHSLWLVLDPRRRFDLSSVKDIISQLSYEVAIHFVIVRDQGGPVRWDWDSLRGTPWLYPRTSALTMDYLTAYLALLRVADLQDSHEDIFDNAAEWTVEMLQIVHLSKQLECVALNLVVHVARHFLPKRSRPLFALPE